MPIISVKRGEVTPFVRKTPTSTCTTILPMQMNRIGKEADPNDVPVKVESTEEAFETFAPTHSFRGTVQGEQRKSVFVAELEFHNNNDFEPANILKHRSQRNAKGEMEWQRNDLADLQQTIQLLKKLRKDFDEASLRRAWDNPSDRQEIIRLIGELYTQVARVAGGQNNG